jgi:hypothetical protein
MLLHKKINKMKDIKKTNILNKSNLRKFILNTANSGNDVGDEGKFTRVSPEAFRNIEAALTVMIAKEVTGLRKGQTIKFDKLGSGLNKLPKFKRTIPEVVADHTSAQIAQMESMNKRLRELEKGQRFLYNVMMPRFKTDNCSTKELFNITEKR